MSETLRFCTFRLDTHFLGVGVGTVQEVLRPQQLTRVPLAPPAVAGLLNLRGQIVSAIDLRRRFGLPPGAPDQAMMNLVLRGRHGPISLLVDEIGEVIEVRPDWFEPPPPTLRGSARALVQGAYKLPDRLLLALDAEQAVACGDAAAPRTERQPGEVAAAAGDPVRNSADSMNPTAPECRKGEEQ